MTPAGVADLLGSIGLPEGHWALFGSGPLLMMGCIDEVGDLDVISRGPAWMRAAEIGKLEVLEDGETIYRIGELLTVGKSWAYGDFDLDALIDTAEVIGGVPCVNIEHVVAYKRIADRPRDREHLAALENCR